MRRAAIATASTILGLVWVLGFRTVPHQLAMGAATGGGEATPAPPAPAPTSQPEATAGALPPTAPPATPTPARTSSGTFTGRTVSMFYGDVEVRLVVSGGRITDAQALKMPTDREESAYISQQVAPILQHEVIQAQSANIDIVSGATYTSDAYAQSVQDALSQAHLG